MRPCATPVTRTRSSTCTSRADRVRPTRTPRSSCCCTAGSGSRSGTAGTPAPGARTWPTSARWWRRRSTAACGAVAAGRSPATTSISPYAACRSCSASSASPPAPMPLIGHSAGGHLALWLATLDLPVDTGGGRWPRSATSARRSGCDLGDDATQALLDGADPATADPMTLLDRRPRPSDRDRARRRGRHRTRLAEPWLRRPAPVGGAARGAGGHMEVIEPGSVAWPTVVDALQTNG